MSRPSNGRCVEVELLNALSARCDAAEPPTPHEVEVAVELGSASLIVLEARLRDLESEAVSVHGALRRSSAERLMAQIEALRLALENLRSRTRSDHTSGLSVGFVLPPRPSAILPAGREISTDRS
jgi:hypothetical protein